MKYETALAVEQGRIGHRGATEAYLESKGWHSTSNYPDFVWRMEKEIEGRVLALTVEGALALEAAIEAEDRLVDAEAEA